MYANNVAAILNGRDIWGFPKKFGLPMLTVQNAPWWVRWSTVALGCPSDHGIQVSRDASGGSFPETFIRSGAAASVDILILGHTRMCLEENEPLRWVGTHRPDIKTITLGDGLALVHRLPDLFRTPSIACIHEKSLDRILDSRK
jgi:hypothetical protein